MSEDLGLFPTLANAINDSFPTPLQSEAIPAILGGGDVLFEVESGKGVDVFGPPMVQLVWETLKFVQNGSRKISNANRRRLPIAVIIEPTKEAAKMTFEKVQRWSKLLNNPDIRCLLALGNMKNQSSQTSLKKGIDIIVGTPARLQELSKGGFLQFSLCRIFVVDDAFVTFRGDPAQMIRNFFTKAPKQLLGSRLQTIVSTNTFISPKIKELAEELMHFPTWIDVKGKDPLPETAFHTVVRINPVKDTSWKELDHQIMTDGIHSVDDFDPKKYTRDTLSEAVKILRGEYIVRAIDAHDMDKGVIVCRTRMDCENLEEYLKYLDKEKYSCASYVPKKGEKQSEKIVRTRFMNDDFKFLICTDDDFDRPMLTRLVGIPFMINACFPLDKHGYLRRVEVVGSQERMGLVINLVAAASEKVWSHGEWCPTKGRDCWNAETWKSQGCAVWQNELTNLSHVEDQFDMKFYEIEPDMKVPFIEIDGKKYYGDEEQRPNFYVNHTVEVADAYKELTQLESQIQSLYLERHLTDKTFPTPTLPVPLTTTASDDGKGRVKRKRISGSARKRMTRAKRQLLEEGGEGGVGGEPSASSTENANKRFRSNNDVGVSSAPDKGPQTGQAAVPKGIRVAIAHPHYPTSHLSSDQLVTLQRSIIKAVELVPDDGPQVRFQECSQKSGWLLIVCTDQESYSWLRNTVKGLVPWEGAQFKVIQERYLIPRTFLFETVIPDDVGVPLTSEEVLTRLRKMNRTLETDKWTVLSQEKSDGGQKWTFRVNMASMKALESMDNKPYFGFGQVQFERTSTFEHPKPKDSPVMAETVKNGTSVPESMEVATSAAKPMEEESTSKEENADVEETVEDEISAVEQTESGISATEPKISANSATEKVGGGISGIESVESKASAAQPIKGDTSVTELMQDATPAVGLFGNSSSATVQSQSGTFGEENDTSIDGPMEDDASMTKSTDVNGSDTQKSEANPSEPISLETWFSGADSSDAWN